MIIPMPIFIPASSGGGSSSRMEDIERRKLRKYLKKEGPRITAAAEKTKANPPKYITRDANLSNVFSNVTYVPEKPKVTKVKPKKVR